MTTVEIQNLSDELKCLIANKTQILLNNERFGTCLPSTLKQELTVLNNYSDIITQVLNSVVINRPVSTTTENIVITLPSGTTILKEKTVTEEYLDNCITKIKINTFEFLLLAVPPSPVPSSWQSIEGGYIKPIETISTIQTPNCQTFESTECFDAILKEIKQLVL